MVEIKIIIKEEKSTKLNNELTATKMNVDIIGKSINATEGEIETSEIIKKRLKIDEKVQVERVKKKPDIDELFEELLKSL